MNKEYRITYILYIYNGELMKINILSFLISNIIVFMVWQAISKVVMGKLWPTGTGLGISQHVYTTKQDALYIIFRLSLALFPSTYLCAFWDIA